MFGAVRGTVGVASPQKWAELLEQAGDEIGNGRFLVRHLGAERYLEPATVAVLISLRQNLISDLQHATTADLMLVDAAVLSYYNMLRVQGWMGDLCLVVERELFGEEPLNYFHGEITAQKIEDQIRRLTDLMLPLQDRAIRMMVRCLAEVRPTTGRGRLNKKPAA